MDPAEAKAQAAALVQVAETLVTKAREEAASIVEDGQRRVAGIIADADALRAAAERDAQTTRAEAEERLAEARRQADDILSEARAAREEAVAAAKDDLAASQAGTPQSGSAGVDPQYAIQEASEVADRILRVARSEAEARGRAITEEARRRAEIVERDSRARAEVAGKEYRDLVRTMQQAELSAKARIRELDTEIARLERLLSRVTEEAERRGIDPSPDADPIEPREVTASGIVFPPSVSRPATPPERDPVPDRDEAPAPAEPAVTRPRPIERLGSPGQPVRQEDLDADKVRRGIRRRA